MGFPVVDHHRHGQVFGQLQLGGEHFLLPVFGALVQPVVVQADLPQSHHLGLLQHVPDLGKPVLRQFPGALRVDAHPAVEVVVPAGQVHRGPAAFQVGAHVDDAADPFLLQAPAQQLLPVFVELGVVVVGVGIKNGVYHHFLYLFSMVPWDQISHARPAVQARTATMAAARG